MNETLLQAEHISLKPMLDNISISIRRGEIVTVIGPNGAGKTSLIELLLDLRKTETGKITKAPGLKIGYVPQKWEINRYMPITAGDFLAIGTDTAPDEDVHHLLHKQLSELSGGELQRVMLARAIARKPNLLVLDEPGQGMDLDGQTGLYAYLDSIRRNNGCGILLVSHDLNFVMATTDRVLCINRHICCEGRPDQVSQHSAFQEMFGAHATRWVAHYSHHHDHQHGLECNHE